MINTKPSLNEISAFATANYAEYKEHAQNAEQHERSIQWLEDRKNNLEQDDYLATRQYYYHKAHEANENASASVEAASNHFTDNVEAYIELARIDAYLAGVAIKGFQEIIII